jgi:transcriptional regulator with XRE-family HTH domain
MDYSKALKVARAITGLQQKELAQRSGLDPSHISLIEKGRRKPSVRALSRLSGALEIPDHLFTLLAAEPQDLAHVSPDELSRIAESLTQFLVGRRNDVPESKKRKRFKKTA